MRRGRTYLLTLALVGLLATALSMLLYATGLLEELEHDTVDARFSIRGDTEPRDDIVLVLIDDVTFNELNIRFPFPRSMHGRVVDRISAGRPKAIAYDIEFLEPTKLREDNALIGAVARAGPGKVVLADTQPDAEGRSGVFGGQEVLDQIGARGANTQLAEDSDGVFRRFPLEVGGLKTFPIATAETVLGREIDEEDLGGDTAWIDFAGRPDTYPAVSFSQVLNGAVPADTFTDKTVVVGASDPSLKDIRPTSAPGDAPMSGPEAEANAIATAIEGFPLQSAPIGIDLLLIALMGFVAPVAGWRLPPLAALATAVGAGALYALAVQLGFGGGTILPVVYPLLALAIAIVGTLIVSYVFEAVERQRVRDTFARFVPEQVVGEVLERTDEDLRLGGRELEVTVLFSDIRSFTTFSEAHTPKEVLDTLNRYHDEMTEAVMEYGGTLTSFIGDGIMAVFGAPIEQDDHADRALAAATEMLEERLPQFNAWAAQRGIEEPFRIGLGLNSGPVMAGNLGARRRLLYTAIGDTVNIAARLEGMTKGTPHQMFVADSTKDRLTREAIRLTFVDEMAVRGRTEAIKIWAPG